VSTGARQGLHQAVLEQRAVGESGQGIVERLVAQLVLERLARGDIAHAEDDALDDRMREAVLRDHLQVPPTAVGVVEPNAQRDRPAPAAALEQQLLRLSRVLGMHEIGELSAEESIGVVPKQVGNRR
jgi:hypothetical protein